MAKWKIEPDVIDLSDFEVTGRGGRVIKPHEGETVSVLPYGANMDNALDQLALRQAFDKKGNVNDEKALSRAIDGMAASLAAVIVDHTLTDLAGEPYPPLHNNPAAIRALPTELLWHLVQAVNGSEDPKDESADTKS